MSRDEPEIPPGIVRFIEQHIPTVPHIEALTLLWETAPQCWTAEDLAARIYVKSDTSRQILGHFTRSGMISPSNNDPSAYTYDSNRELAAIVPEVARFYRRHLTRITKLIHFSGSDAVRSFSRASHSDSSK